MCKSDERSKFSRVSVILSWVPTVAVDIRIAPVPNTAELPRVVIVARPVFVDVPPRVVVAARRVDDDVLFPATDARVTFVDRGCVTVAARDCVVVARDAVPRDAFVVVARDTVERFVFVRDVVESDPRDATERFAFVRDATFPRPSDRLPAALLGVARDTVVRFAVVRDVVVRATFSSATLSRPVAKLFGTTRDATTPSAAKDVPTSIAINQNAGLNILILLPNYAINRWSG